ncbi:MAG: HNH endonuclease [Clostridiaceae bacterium]|nr:HNH endonuclease [Clostridiaceae bacterium]
MSFSEFEFKTAFSLASQIYLEIVDGVNEFYPSDFFKDKPEFYQKILTPHKQTLLHDYINYIHEFGIDYVIDKTGYDEIIDEVIGTLDNYGVEYDEPDQEADDLDDYYQLLIEKYKTLTPYIVNEVFTLLFNDKKLMRTFNENLADEIICNLKRNDYPEVLTKDGVIKRCEYIPTWLKDGVFFRDKGRCQLCGKDLTRLLSSDNKIHYDHIIPLEMGGNNDPTNFQILCESCNTSKRDRHSGTRNLFQVFW